MPSSEQQAWLKELGKLLGVVIGADSAGGENARARGAQGPREKTDGQAGESGEETYRAISWARKSSSHPAALRFRRNEALPGAFRIRLWAICLMVAKLAGAWSVRTRHSSSRKIMSKTQCRLFSMPSDCG
jgi:hypothetical protein